MRLLRATTSTHRPAISGKGMRSPATTSPKLGRETAVHNLDVLGVRVGDVRAVVPSHGHLDHHGSWGVPRMARRDYRALLLLAVPLIGIFTILYVSKPWGIGLSPDSTTYVRVARGLFRGSGLNEMPTVPSHHCTRRYLPSRRDSV